MNLPIVSRATSFLAALAVCAPALTLAQARESENLGFVLGRVYEVDKEKYRDYVDELRNSDIDLDEAMGAIDPDEFLDRRADTVVTARQLSSNQQFSSNFTGASGEYAIRESPVGTFEFTLFHEGTEYPVQQRLDLNVQLSYVAELCFVVDPEEGVAWMVADGSRRAADVPPWVPRECRSALSECLAGLTGIDDTLPDGLLLLLAGSGATATTIGIISADQIEASSPVNQNEPDP